MVNDNFERKGRWDSVGLDCSSCLHFKSPEKWPDKNHEIFCNLHKVSLITELGKSDFKEGEWFCKHFKDNGKSLRSAVIYFDKIKNSFEENILYRFEKQGDDFKEIKIK